MGRQQLLPLGAVLLLVAMLGSAQASLMAIDLGSEFLKVSLIKPGRTPIAIVVNEMSKRKTPALVGFANGERLLGEEAASFAVRFPETTFARARDMLGKPHDDPSVVAMLKDHLLPYKVVPHPERKLAAALQVSDGVVYSAEELVGSTLQYAKQIAEAQSGAPVPDAVIAVPAHFGQAQRQGIIDAAALVGINVLGLINTHTAAALQFGIERDFANKTQNVIFYDMGSGGTIVSLVRYSSYTAKDAPGGKPISQLEVKDVDWDADLGANSLDAVLIDHFVKMFAEKAKVPLEEVLANPRSMAKMKKQVKRTKEMLSANTAAPMQVEELHDGKDFQASIKREEFEALAAGFFERAAAPLKRVLDRSGLKPEEIDYVEMLGGGTRVPRLQAALSELLGGRALDRHVDSDEGVVLGASLFAANLSTSFRLRKFGMADLAMYGITLKVDEAHEPALVGDAKAESGEGSERNLLPFLKKLPVKRVVHFTNLTKDPLRVSLSYNTSTLHSLPPGATGPELASFVVTGIDTVIKRYNNSGTVNLRFEASYDGILQLSKAEAVVDYIVMEEKRIPIKTPVVNTTANATANAIADAAAAADGAAEEKEKGKEGASAAAEADETKEGGEEEGEEEPAGGDDAAAASAEEDPAAAADKEGEAEEAASDMAEDKESKAGDKAAPAKDAKDTNATAPPKIKYETITVASKRTAKVRLNVSATWATPAMGEAVSKLARANVAGWVAAEAAKRATAAAKNELEAYFIRMREAVENDEKLHKVSTPDQRTSFQAALTEAEDWLYMDGEGEEAPAFKAKLATLRKVGDAIEDRAQEAEQRPAAASAARKEAELKSAALGLWEGSRPWITDEERKDVSIKIAAFLSWLDGKEAAQAKKEPHEAGAFTAREVATEFEKMDRFFNKISNKRKPKPPPEPPAADAAANATEGDAPKDAPAGGDATPEGSKGKQEEQQQQQQDGDSKSKVDPPEGSKAEEPSKEQAAADKAAKEAADKAKKEAADKAAKEAAAAKAKKDKEAAAKKAAADKAKKDKEAKAKKDKDAKAKKEKEAAGGKGGKGGAKAPPPTSKAPPSKSSAGSKKGDKTAEL